MRAAHPRTVTRFLSYVKANNARLLRALIGTLFGYVTIAAITPIIPPSPSSNPSTESNSRNLQCSPPPATDKPKSCCPPGCGCIVRGERLVLPHDPPGQKEINFRANRCCRLRHPFRARNRAIVYHHQSSQGVNICPFCSNRGMLTSQKCRFLSICCCRSTGLMPSGRGGGGGMYCCTVTVHLVFERPVR